MNKCRASSSFRNVNCFAGERGIPDRRPVHGGDAYVYVYVHAITELEMRLTKE